MEPLDLAGKKVVTVGLLLVAEDEKYTCHIQIDELGPMVEKLGGQMQGSVNKNTDIIVTGSTEREKDWDNSLKGKACLEQMRQMDKGTRDKPLLVISLRDFCRRTGITNTVIARATTACYGIPTIQKKYGSVPNKKYLAPGPSRGRSSLLPRTLVLNDGSGVAKGLASMYINPISHPELYWPEV